MTPEPTPKEKPVHHEIFVGDIRQTWTQDIVSVNDILAQAGVAPPDNFILEALERPGGKSVAELRPGTTVNLAEKDRKFFRVTPGGGGFS